MTTFTRILVAGLLFSRETQAKERSGLTSTAQSPQAIASFHLTIPQAQIEDLQERLARTRWPEEVPELDWSYGPPVAYLRNVVD